MQPVPKCCSVCVRTRPAKVAVKAQAVETAAAVVAVAHKPPVVTVAEAVVMAAARAVADAVVITTLPVHKAHAVPSKATAVVVAVVKAAGAHLWVTRNRVATKAVSAAAWASVLPAAPQAVNLILCAPVSI